MRLGRPQSESVRYRCPGRRRLRHRRAGDPRKRQVVVDDDNTRGYSFDSAQHLVLQDVGLVLLAFGVLALAAVLNQWIASERPGRAT